MIFQTCAGAKGFRKWFVTMAGAICPRGVVDEKWACLFFDTEEVHKHKWIWATPWSRPKNHIRIVLKFWWAKKSHLKVTKGTKMGHPSIL